MLILAAHTSTPALGIAVSKDGVVIAEEILTQGREHLENISGVIEQILVKTGFQLGDFDGLGIAIGPGSFSGIRVGLSVFKGLALALKLKIVGLSTLEILTWQAVDIGEVAIPLLEAGRGEVFTGMFKKRPDDCQIIKGPQLLNKQEITHFVSGEHLSDPILCGVPELFEDLIGHENQSRKAITSASPGACGILAEKRLVKGSFDDIHRLTPLYVRRSDAEEKKRKTHS